MSYAVSWSGGKDSCFACYLAGNDGYKISHLLNFISQESGKVGAHGTEAGLISLQSHALGVPLIQRTTTWENYEHDLKDAVMGLKAAGVDVEGVIFGDIYLPEHRDWVERVCDDLGVRAVEPLWGKTPDNILSGFIDAGFEAVIVSARSSLIDECWIGRIVDKEFITYLKDRAIDLCGENGEYHTLVTAGPIFRGKIQITGSETVSGDGRWFLNTTGYQLVV
ncbi:MAG: diphthine--ammonia ligase [Chloroflexota bacterium]